jgi:hypothetical protein
LYFKENWENNHKSQKRSKKDEEIKQSLEDFEEWEASILIMIW